MLDHLVGKLIDEGAFEQARTVARQWTELHPDNPAAWHLLGAVWLASGEPAEAGPCLRRSLELGGEEFWCCYQMSTVHLLRGDMEGTIEWCRRALKLRPEEPRLFTRLVEAYTYQAELDQAVKFARKAVKVAKGRPEKFAVRMMLGNLCMTIQSLAEAAEQFQEALKLDPTSTDAWMDLGHCHSRLGKSDEALSAFRKGVELDPHDPGLLYDLGDAYLAVGEPEKAIGPLMRAVQQKPDFALTYYDLSLAFFEMDKYGEGAAAASAALRGDENMESAQINLGLGATQNLGICLMNQGKTKEALACFDRNLKLLAPTYFNRGLTLLKMGKHQEALRNFERALEIQPNDPEYLDLLGQAYCELGRLREGERWLRRAVEADPKYAVGHLDLGICLAKTKAKQKQARRCFERALSLDSEMEEAHYALACLHAASGKQKLALECLERALDKGFRDFKRIEGDRNLTAVRREKEFRQLMARFRKA